MARLLKILIAFALFTGAGFVTRPLFQQWLESKLKETEAANKKETANWKPVQVDFQEIKMDQPKFSVPKNNPPINMPKINVPQPPPFRYKK
jgi:hypothetical protein